MKRLAVFLAFVSIILAGCVQSKEHLVINKDGSGTLEANLKVPESTRRVIDSLMGGMVKGMAEAFGEGEKAPKSISEEMFGNKEQYLEKAKKVGLNMEFLNFNKEIKEKDLYVDFKIKYDDINKLLASDIIATKFKLSKDPNGDLVCFIESQPNKVGEAKMQKEEFEKWKKEVNEKASKGDSMEAKAGEQFLEGLKNFKTEFIITMPNDIKKASGMFNKKDSNTASLEVSGDFFEDPSVLEKLYGMKDPSEVVCSGDGLAFEIRDASALREDAQTIPTVSSSDIKIYLKDGKIFEGKLVEETESHIKFDKGNNMIFTFLKSEIEKIEHPKPQPSDAAARSGEEMGVEKNSLIAETVQRFDFKLDSPIKLKGTLNPEIVFSICGPKKEFKWAKFLKAIINLQNATSSDRYAYVTVALFDKDDNLLGASGSSWMKDNKIEPGKLFFINSDFALAGYKTENIAYFLINYKESDKSLLPWN